MFLILLTWYGIFVILKKYFYPNFSKVGLVDRGQPKPKQSPPFFFWGGGRWGCLLIMYLTLLTRYAIFVYLIGSQNIPLYYFFRHYQDLINDLVQLLATLLTSFCTIFTFYKQNLWINTDERKHNKNKHIFSTKNS